MPKIEQEEMGLASFLRVTVARHRRECRTEQGDKEPASFRREIVRKRRRNSRSGQQGSSVPTSPETLTRDSTILRSHASAVRRRPSSSNDHSVPVAGCNARAGVREGAAAVGAGKNRC